MKSLLWVLTLFALAVGISLAANFNDGYLLLVSPPYRVEVSLSLAILILFVVFALFYALLRTIALTQSLPQRVRDFRERQQREKSGRSIYEATRLLFEGRYSQALKKAVAAHEEGPSRALAALLAARSVQRLGEYSKQQAWLESAEQLDPTMHVACQMLAAEMHIEQRNFAEAGAVLKRLQQSSGVHIAALLLELRAQQGCGNQDEILRLTRLLEKHDALPLEHAMDIKQAVHRENIRMNCSDPEKLKAYLRDMPEREKNSQLIFDCAEALIAQGEFEEAQRQIEAQLVSDWDPQLVDLYGQDSGIDLASRTCQAEKWLLEHPDDSRLLLALGRMCLAQGAWEKAQTYLDASLSLADCSETRLELARMFELTARDEDALKHYRAAAEQLK